MQLEKISHSIQIITGIVVIIGVVLVIVELRQTKELARAQLASDSWGMSISRIQAMAGENPAHAYGKLCDSGIVDTTEDALVVHNLFLQRVHQIQRAHEIALIGGFDDSRWKMIANGNLPFVFATEYGRVWWNTGRQYINKEVLDYGDSLLSGIGPAASCPGVSTMRTMLPSK
jgi:hypothetical protein